LTLDEREGKHSAPTRGLIEDQQSASPAYGSYKRVDGDFFDPLLARGKRSNEYEATFPVSSPPLGEGVSLNSFKGSGGVRSNRMREMKWRTRNRSVLLLTNRSGKKGHTKKNRSLEEETKKPTQEKKRRRGESAMKNLRTGSTDVE